MSIFVKKGNFHEVIEFEDQPGATLKRIIDPKKDGANVRVALEMFQAGFKHEYRPKCAGVEHILSGRIRFIEDRQQFELGPGETVHLPVDVPFSIEVLEALELFSVATNPRYVRPLKHLLRLDGRSKSGVAFGRYRVTQRRMLVSDTDNMTLYVRCGEVMVCKRHDHVQLQEGDVYYLPRCEEVHMDVSLHGEVILITTPCPDPPRWLHESPGIMF